MFRKYGARFLVRGGQSVTPEGTVRQRNVVLEFPSYADAVACYQRAVDLFFGFSVRLVVQPVQPFVAQTGDVTCEHETAGDR